MEDLFHDRRLYASINDKNIKNLKKMVSENHCVTVREISKTVNISVELTHAMLHDVFEYSVCVMLQRD